MKMMTMKDHTTRNAETLELLDPEPVSRSDQNVDLRMSSRIQADNSDGSVGKIFGILELITETRPLIRVEDVEKQFGFNRSTSYRYVRILCNIGMLSQAGCGFYSLGPRIVELERMMNLTQPILQAAQIEMPSLLETMPNSAVLLSTLYKDRVLCVHKLGVDEIVRGGEVTRLLRSKGVPLPLFFGATSLAILAFQSTPRIKSLYLNRQEELADAGLASDWKPFRAQLMKIRREGSVATEGQHNPMLAAIAVPVFSGDGTEVRAALTRTIAREDMPPRGPGELIVELQECAKRISARAAQNVSAWPSVERKRG